MKPSGMGARDFFGGTERKGPKRRKGPKVICERLCSCVPLVPFVPGDKPPKLGKGWVSTDLQLNVAALAGLQEPLPSHDFLRLTPHVARNPLSILHLDDAEFQSHD